MVRSARTRRERRPAFGSSPLNSFVAAIDQGTTSTRVMVFDTGLRVVALAQREHRQICPQPGWVEHDPAEILRNVQELAAQALNEAGIDATQLAAVGIANQRETALLWERASGRALGHAIVWQDCRTESLVQDIVERVGPQGWRERTGLPPANYFSACKLQWLLREHAGAAQAAARGDVLFGTVDAWLAWNLTGGADGGRHVSDVTNASRTNLFDIGRLQWDAEICEALGIPPACLPRVVPTSQRIGRIRDGALRGAELAALVGDQQGALIGQACFAPGQAKVTYGTGSFLLMHTGERAAPSASGLLSTVAYRLGAQPPCYALEGSIAVTGSLVRWLRDNLGLIGSAAEIEELARSVPDNGDVYFVPAFSGLFAPHWRPDARGVLVGLTHFAHRGHIARAALEATAFQVQEIVAAMQRDSGMNLRDIKVDGGMSANSLLMQFQADLLDTPVIRPVCGETTALGTACAAGLAVGLWSGTDELASHWQAQRRWEPSMPQAERERLLGRWRQAVQRSLDWSEPQR